jgi:NAD(P)-dependent dehydrogenase (short-subunit alcohol dehydrogenase family)/acyl carrier protein
MGESFVRLDQHAYTISLARPDDYSELLADLRNRELSPEGVIHLWGVTGGGERLSFERSQERGFYSLLWLARAAGAQELGEALEVSVVTNHMQGCCGGEAGSAEKATVLGACRVIPQEYPNITCRSIDVVLPEQEMSQRRRVVVEQLCAEVQAQSREPVVAYRGAYRLVADCERVRIEARGDGARDLREGGVYLITGGLGGIGYTLAEFLAESARAKLVLLARTALPERGQWEQQLAGGDGADQSSGDDEVERRMAKVKRLEELGAEVLVLNANVADEEQLRAAVGRATDRFGKIHGVIHAAGVAGGGVIQFKTAEDVARVFAPKVKGALLLNAIFKDDELDFLVFCSSLKSVLGEFGQSDYCAARIFLDAFAHSLRFAGATNATSINWDTWAEIGMAVNTKAQGTLGRLQEETLSEGISPREGVDAFTRALMTRLPQIFVSVRDLQPRVERASAARELLEQLDMNARAVPAYPRPELSNAYIAPGNALEQSIADVWQRVLGIEQIGVNDNFFELGGDSLTAVQLAAELKREFGLQVPVVKLFEGPTINSLAKILDPEGDENPAFARRQERGVRRREKRKRRAPEEA